MKQKDSNPDQNWKKIQKKMIFNNLMQFCQSFDTLASLES